MALVVSVGALRPHHASLADLKATSICVRMLNHYTACYDAPRKQWGACFSSIYAENITVPDPAAGFIEGRQALVDSLSSYPTNYRDLSGTARKGRFVPGSNEMKVQCSYEGITFNPYGDQIWGVMQLPIDLGSL